MDFGIILTIVYLIIGFAFSLFVFKDDAKDKDVDKSALKITMTACAVAWPVTLIFYLINKFSKK